MTQEATYSKMGTGVYVHVCTQQEATFHHTGIHFPSSPLASLEYWAIYDVAGELF